MNFEYSQTSQDLQAKLNGFIQEHIVPVEAEFVAFQQHPKNLWKRWTKIEELNDKILTNVNLENSEEYNQLKEENHNLKNNIGVLTTYITEVQNTMKEIDIPKIDPSQLPEEKELGKGIFFKKKKLNF